MGRGIHHALWNTGKTIPPLSLHQTFGAGGCDQRAHERTDIGGRFIIVLRDKIHNDCKKYY